ncbi:lytic transglycosylase domain-containing protein [Burkholderia gladioli]|uniref:lytic transglycosylase domain-containing protein n=1 Tax=Burkholderia gladioli TaxID=28095 RepID=UPI000BBD2E0B|nr:lytic transglycosylase domain-containing protein [Burkholderia gladioli]ATF87573.1 hypothetical protein CO712_20935 [Burkholderia gladioli pv. gladioli]
MANKPIIQVPVDDAQFREFYEMFQEFQGRLDSIPEDWKRIDDAARKAEHAMTDIAGTTDESRKALMVAAIQANAIAHAMEDAVKAGRNFAKTSKEGSDSMSKIEKSAQGVAKSIFSIGGYLLKLGALGAGIAGLGGLFGSIGLRELAHGAVDTQNTARGIGVTPGELTAFRQDFGVYGFNEGILQRMADAQADTSKRVYLSMATKRSLEDVASADPSNLAIDALRNAGEWWKNTPPEQRTAQLFNATGAPQAGISLNDARLAAASLERFPQATKDFESDARKYNTTDSTGDGWRSFIRQLSDAGNTIQTDLTNRLVTLGPPLEAFISTLTVDAKQLINEVLTPENLDKMTKGIGEFVNYLSSADFRTGIKTFADGVKRIADDVAILADGLDRVAGLFKKMGVDNQPGDQQQIGNGLVDFGKDIAKGDFSKAWWDLNTPLPGAGKGAGKPEQSATPLDRLAGALQKVTGEPAYFREMERKAGLPEGLLYSQEMVESRGDVGAISPKGAMGPFQFMKDTAKQYGLADPFNLHDSADAASRMMGDMMKRYKGDVRKALAAYNWGMGNAKHPALDAAIAAHGDQWEQYAPRETRDYISKITAALAKQKLDVKVHVTNSTSAKVAVQANAAGM